MEDSISITVVIDEDPELKFGDLLLDADITPESIKKIAEELEGSQPLDPWAFDRRYAELDEQDRLNTMLVNAPVRLGRIGK